MKRVTFDPLTARCEVCGRKVAIVHPWLPHGEGIRHASCIPSCHACGDGFSHPLAVAEDEAGNWFHEDCAPYEVEL